MKKILIIGGSGFVGSYIIKHLPVDWEKFCTFNSNPISSSNLQSFKIDLLDNPKEIVTLIQNIKPDYIVHTVAFPSVDYCEEKPLIADKLHVNTTKIISNHRVFFTIINTWKSYSMNNIIRFSILY